MEKIVVKVDGMQCGMCEAHVNEAVRATFPVKKVTSSHAKGEKMCIRDRCTSSLNGRKPTMIRLTQEPIRQRLCRENICLLYTSRCV